MTLMSAMGGKRTLSFTHDLSTGETRLLGRTRSESLPTDDWGRGAQG
jgi:hypothetical protein